MRSNIASLQLLVGVSAALSCGPTRSESNVPPVQTQRSSSDTIHDGDTNARDADSTIDARDASHPLEEGSSTPSVRPGTTPTIEFDERNRVSIEGFPAVSGDGRRILVVTLDDLRGTSPHPTTDALVFNTRDGSIAHRSRLVTENDIERDCNLSTPRTRRIISSRIERVRHEISRGGYLPMILVGLWPSTHRRRPVFGYRENPDQSQSATWTIAVNGSIVHIREPNGTSTAFEFDNRVVHPCLRTMTTNPEIIEVWHDETGRQLFVGVLYSAINGCLPGMPGHPVSETTHFYFLPSPI